MISETSGRGGLRERLRTHVRDDVKRIALRQLAEGGPPTLSVNAIARELGVSGPALYRYFKSRDDLLTELVLDALPPMGHDRAASLSPSLRSAYPRYDAHRDSLVDAAQRLMGTLLDAMTDAAVPPGQRPSAKLAGQLTAWGRKRGIDVDPAVAHRAIVVWSRLHGLVSLDRGQLRVDGRGRGAPARRGDRGALRAGLAFPPMAYVVCALWRAKEGSEERVAEIVGELLEPSRAEPGNLFYQPHRSPEDPRLFFLYEQYVDEAGYQAHMDSEHFTRLVKNEAIPELLESRERSFYVTLD
jgi:quinol monooxygenase YgiN